MKKESTSMQNSGAYTSPATPDYGNNNIGGIQKGWSSERVPLPTNISRRHINTAAFMPFNSGRALPSKWDDAERWITSPVSGYGIRNPSTVQPQRQPMSKSGPLGTPLVTYFSHQSPPVPVLEGGESIKNFMVGSPFTTGVLVPDGISIHYNSRIGAQFNPEHDEHNIARSSSVPGWSDVLTDASLSSSQGEKVDTAKDEDTMVSLRSRRDMATQMSPEDSTQSSPRGRLSFSASPPLIPPILEPAPGHHSAKVEVRDVEVDKRVTMTRQSKKHGPRTMKKDLPNAKGLASSWDVTEAAKDTSKLQREEAKITAWENLQKAKAEAAIRKLEMKLEKKRSVSMDKILNKLGVAQMRAQEMRNSVSKVPRSSSKIIFFRKMKSAGAGCCFSCHAS